MLPATVMCGHSAYDWNIIAVARFSGGSRVMSSPATRIVPVVRDHEAGDRAQQRRLAAAGAAEQRDHLAALDVEAHAVEHARAAVRNGQRLDRKIGGHRLTSATHGRALATRSGVSVNPNCYSGHAAPRQSSLRPAVPADSRGGHGFVTTAIPGRAVPKRELAFAKARVQGRDAVAGRRRVVAARELRGRLGTDRRARNS